MTDRELLELAAKAAGYDGVRPAMFGTDCWMALIEGDWQPWNPLTEDGDALRLAVKLRIDVGFGFAATTINATHYDWREEEEDVGIQQDGREDEYAATRRAIVKAAAAIGEKQ